MILGQEGLSFPYVPEHLYYILMELIKNSLRAVVETNSNIHHGDDLPPIKIVVNKDYSLTEGSQVIIRVSDEGETSFAAYLLTNDDDKVSRLLMMVFSCLSSLFC